VAVKKKRKVLKVGISERRGESLKKKGVLRGNYKREWYSTKKTAW